MRGLAISFVIATLLLVDVARAQHCPVPESKIQSIELLTRLRDHELTAEVSFREPGTDQHDFCAVMRELPSGARHRTREPRRITGDVSRARFVVRPNVRATFALICYHREAQLDPATPGSPVYVWCNEVVDRATIFTAPPARLDLLLRAGETSCHERSGREARRPFLETGLFKHADDETCVSLPFWHRHRSVSTQDGGVKTLLERDHVVVRVWENRLARTAIVAVAASLSLFMLLLVRRRRARQGVAVFCEPAPGGFRDSARRPLRVVRCPRQVRELGGAFASSDVRLKVHAKGVTFFGADLVATDANGQLAYLMSGSTVPFGSALIIEDQALLLRHADPPQKHEQDTTRSALRQVTPSEVARATSGTPNLISPPSITARELVPVLAASALAPFTPRILFSLWPGAGQTAVAVPLVALATVGVFLLAQSVSLASCRRTPRSSSLSS